MNRPTIRQYVAYSFGRPLPEDLRGWVRRDLAGEHAVARHLFRSMVPFLPLFAAGLLVPGPFLLRGASVLLAVILGLIYAFAFMDMNRRRRLTQHGLPADLQSDRTLARRVELRTSYERVHRYAD